MRNILLLFGVIGLVAGASAPAHAGVILGKVTIKGKAPTEPTAALGKEELIRYQRSLLVSDKGGLANAVIYLPGAPAGEPSSESDKAVLDQREETYVPHVVPILKGATVEFINSDNLLHNVHAFQDDASLFNRAMPLRGQRSSRRFDHVGVVRVTCDVHKHMRAYVRVLDNRYFTTTNESGLFVIKGVPPGTYEVRLWHERLSEELTGSVKVTADGKAPVVFDIPAESITAK